jgi:hypothetical protein
MRPRLDVAVDQSSSPINPVTIEVSNCLEVSSASPASTSRRTGLPYRSFDHAQRRSRRSTKKMSKSSGRGRGPGTRCHSRSPPRWVAPICALFSIAAEYFDGAALPIERFVSEAIAVLLTMLSRRASSISHRRWSFQASELVAPMLGTM